MATGTGAVGGFEYFVEGGGLRVGLVRGRGGSRVWKRAEWSVRGGDEVCWLGWSLCGV